MRIQPRNRAVDIYNGFKDTGVSPYNRQFYDYIYGTPKDRRQYYVQSFFAGAVPALAGLYTARDNTAYMDDYMKNRGIDWSDIKYPSRTVGYSGGYALGNSVRGVSRNVVSLYKK